MITRWGSCEPARNRRSRPLPATVGGRSAKLRSGHFPYEGRTVGGIGMANVAKPEGLEDVVAGPSDICYLDGVEGRLLYRGVDIHDLAAHSTFEETVYLLWRGDLPTAAQLRDFTAELGSHLKLTPDLVEFLRALPADALPMDTLRTVVSFLGVRDPGAIDLDAAANGRRAVAILGALPAIAATAWRLAHGQAPIDPDPRLGLAANFLYMLRGQRGDELEERVMDVALILHADHEYNASTFAARVVASTLSDLYSALTGAIGALKGPLHGGANEQVMNLLLRIGDPDKTEEQVRGMLAAHRKVPGFGHRVYRTDDPRTQHLREFSRQLSERTGDSRWLKMQATIERLLKDTHGLYCNVDFYSATTYYNLGIPLALYTPIFVIARTSGWTAHVLEQYANNRLIRPRSEYVGPTHREYIPLAARG